MAKIVKKYSKTTLVLGLLFVLVLMYSVIPNSQAASITSRKMTVSDSRPNPQSGVIYTFTGTHSATSVYCIRVQYCTAATGACTKPTNMVTTAATRNDSGFSGWTAASWTISNITDGETKFTNAVGQAGGAGYAVSMSTITNPNAGVYYARVTTYTNTDCATGSTDTGTVAYSIISGVTVSATVSESLSFAIALVTNANCDTSFAAYDGPDSTATTVPFGTLAAVDTFNHACQDLTLSTNANSGYVITVQELTNLRDSTIAKNISDSTGDSGTMTESVSNTWATAAAHSGFGYSCANNAGGGTDCAFTYTNYRQFACTGSDANCDPGAGGETQQTIMSNAGPVSASSSRVEYKLSVSGVQQAGTYSNTVMYIATPTY